ncbi:hypothetical protein FRC03_007504, partial [Tulasnella sp. 419]
VQQYPTLDLLLLSPSVVKASVKRRMLERVLLSLMGQHRAGYSSSELMKCSHRGSRTPTNQIKSALEQAISSEAIYEDPFSISLSPPFEGRIIGFFAQPRNPWFSIRVYAPYSRFA